MNCLHGKNEAGWIALSREYLHSAIYAIVSADAALQAVNDGAQWIETRLAVEIDAVMSQHKARTGYATLAGGMRPVWVLRQGQIKPEKGKALRPEPVDVVERI